MGGPIFLSWGEPDEQAVAEVRERLEALSDGTLWYAPRDMTAGRVDAQIENIINDATAAIVCVSAESIDRPWVEFEMGRLNACFQGDLSRIQPIWVGGGRPDWAALPSSLHGLNVLEWHKDPDGAMVQLAKWVGGFLPLKPIVVPALLIATTSARWSELVGRIHEAPGYEELVAACASVGVSEDRVVDTWGTRFGASRREYSPYASGRPLVASIHSALNTVNGARNAEGHPPILLEWLQFEDRRLSDPGERTQWGSQRPLVIVDSVSLLDREIAEFVRDLPEVGGGFSALVCVPPFSRETADLQEYIAAAHRRFARLSDWLTLARQGRFAGAADIATDATFQAVISGALQGIDGAAKPQPKHVCAMVDHTQQPTRFPGFFGGAGARRAGWP